MTLILICLKKSMIYRLFIDLQDRDAIVTPHNTRAIEIAQ